MIILPSTNGIVSCIRPPADFGCAVRRSGFEPSTMINSDALRLHPEAPDSRNTCQTSAPETPVAPATGPGASSEGVLMRGVPRLLGTALLAVALTATGTAASAASAASAGGDLGRTDVVIAPAVLDLIQSAGIDVAPTGAATAGAFMGTVRAKFPIRAIKQAGNKITHDGGLRFSTDDVAIKASQLTILVSEALVTGKARGSEIGAAGRVPLFTLAETTDPDLGAFDLLLTDTAAGAINATFGTSLAAGDLFGHATPRPN
jgi:hypothetical protein